MKHNKKITDYFTLKPSNNPKQMMVAYNQNQNSSPFREDFDIKINSIANQSQYTKSPASPDPSPFSQNKSKSN